MTRLELKTQQLYEEDYVLWVDKTVEQLQNRDLNNLDWEHLIEEIEDLGSEQRHKVSSYLKQILIHLLLYRYWISERNRCAKGWEDEIDNFRDELTELFKSTTLYNYCIEEIDTVYLRARRRAIKKTSLPPETFPEQCPFTAEQILDFDFLPD